MVDSAIPVARATCAMPPYPIACASVAAHTRRDRSVRTGDSAPCFARRVARSTSARYYSLIRSTRSYFLTGPKGKTVFVGRLPHDGVKGRASCVCPKAGVVESPCRFDRLSNHLHLRTGEQRHIVSQGIPACISPARPVSAHQLPNTAAPHVWRR